MNPALLLLLIACGDKEKDSAAVTDTDTDTTTDDTGPTGSGADPATVELHGMCDLADDYGGFIVESYVEDSAEEEYSIVSGSIADSVVPLTILEVIGAEGGCEVKRRNNPFCDPSCESGQTCDFDGECITYPSNQDLGIVDILGLPKAVQMEAVIPGNTYFNTSLPHPAFEGGELIELQMPGGTYGPITLYGVGVEELAANDKEWRVESGHDLIVSWDAPVGEIVRSEVTLSINIDQHGTSPSSVYCTFEDNGEGTVPASIVQQLVEVGVSGFPSGVLKRRTADRADASDGCTDFEISSRREVDVDVIGYTPCMSNNDCPAEKPTCNLELQICE
jgi:hypothetical protein